MTIDLLLAALEEDGALFFDEEQVPIHGQGWAWKYANSLVTISSSFDFVVLYCRAGTVMDDEDMKDLTIIARSLDYRVDIRGNRIAFHSMETDFEALEEA